jgi:uncharacterized protein
MSAPAFIDSLHFARAEQSLRGSLPFASFRRLDDVLFDPDGQLAYELRGGSDARRRPQLELTVRGTPHLQCQRCLGRLEYALELRSVLVVIAPGAALDEDLNDPDAPDVIEASSELDVAALIEDEVLLSLPLSPRHPEGVCASRDPVGTGEDLRSPFLRLAGLRNRPDST